MSEYTICVQDRDGDGNCHMCARNPDAVCQMTPRDAIHWLFRNGLTDYRLEIFLNAYAHELAEKIRTETRGAWIETLESGWIRNGLYRAADLIDIDPKAHLELE